MELRRTGGTREPVEFKCKLVELVNQKYHIFIENVTNNTGNTQNQAKNKQTKTHTIIIDSNAIRNLKN